MIMTLRKHICRLAATVLCVAVMIVGSSVPASAAPPDGSSGDGASVCASSTEPGYDYQYLPAMRWNGATQEFHVRSNGGVIDLTGTQRQLQGLAFTTGDFLYAVTVKFTEWSTTFCPLNAVGDVVDGAAGKFGKSIMNSALLAALLVCSLVGLIAAGFRGQGKTLSRLGAKVGIVVLMAVMVFGATESGTDSEGNFRPGFGSPGWFASVIDSTISQLAAAPAAVITAPQINGTVGVDHDELACGPYVAALLEGYEQSVTNGQGSGVSINTASVPAKTVSALWQVSGYKAWAVAQFGNKNLNGQNRVACRMLDQNAGIPVAPGTFRLAGRMSDANVTSVMAMVPDQQMSSTSTGIVPDAPAWRPLSNTEQDKAWIAWAACVPKDGKLANIDEPDGWHTPKGQKWLIADEDARQGAEASTSDKLDIACYDFFNDSGSEKVSKIFDWGDGDKQLKKHAAEMPASIYDFISTLHGTKQSAAGGAALAYVITALGVLLVYGGIGLAITIVKVVATFMLFAVMFVLLLALLPGPGGGKRIANYAKTYLGLSVTAAFGVFIMSLVTLFTNIVLQLIGRFAGGPNSIMTMLLGGLAPVIAAAALHMAFKRAGMPSPMTVNGAMSWGDALVGGAGGAAITAGAQYLSVGARSAGGQIRNKLQPADTKIPKGAQRNADISTAQKQPVAGSTEHQAFTSGNPRRTPEQVLNDPNATWRAKRAAQQQRVEEYAEAKKDAKFEKELEQDDQEQEAAHANADRPSLQDRINQLRADPASTIGGAARSAGQQTGKVIAEGARGATGAAKVSASRWADQVAANPGRTLSHGARSGAKAGLKGAAVVAGGAVLLGAGGGAALLAGATVAGGTVASKRGLQAAGRRLRTHNEHKQQAIENYRAEAEERRGTPENHPLDSTETNPQPQQDHNRRSETKQAQQERALRQSREDAADQLEPYDPAPSPSDDWTQYLGPEEPTTKGQRPSRHAGRPSSQSQDSANLGWLHKKTEHPGDTNKNPEYQFPDPHPTDPFNHTGEPDDGSGNGTNPNRRRRQ